MPLRNESQSMLEMGRKIIQGELPQPPVSRLIGFRLVAIEPGTAVMEMEASKDHANPMGTLHGGILCDLADAAMGLAYASTLKAGESFATLELKINYIRPFWTGHLEAIGKVVHGGRSVGLTECDVKDGTGDLIARATSTCMTLRDEQARGR